MINIQPQNRSFSLASASIQDEITLVPDTLRLLLGLRLEDNSFFRLSRRSPMRA